MLKQITAPLHVCIIFMEIAEESEYRRTWTSYAKRGLDIVIVGLDITNPLFDSPGGDIGYFCDTDAAAISPNDRCFLTDSHSVCRPTCPISLAVIAKKNYLVDQDGEIGPKRRRTFCGIRFPGRGLLRLVKVRREFDLSDQVFWNQRWEIAIAEGLCTDWKLLNTCRT
jgi:hypothetical protein